MSDQSFEIADLDLAAATERVGDAFRVTLEDAQELDFELVEAKPLTGAPETDAQTANRSFSMLFRGPTDPLLSQGILAMENDAWGTCHLFAVPVERDATGTYYEAIINRQG